MKGSAFLLLIIAIVPITKLSEHVLWISHGILITPQLINLYSYLVLPLLHTLLEDDSEAVTEYSEIIVIFPLQIHSYTESVQTSFQ